MTRAATWGEPVGADAGDVDHDLQRVLGLEDVQRRRALAGDERTAFGALTGQVLEQAPDFVRQVGGVVSGHQVGHHPDSIAVFTRRDGGRAYAGTVCGRT